ncbi:MAG TPA: DUF4174 domain-containing protein [Salinibacter sp.]|nr:DUF4174 domain-containing protein [Salinibacter sp.]
MRLIPLLLILSALFSPAMADSPPDSVDFRLDAHRWEHRLLFVFASSDTADAPTVQRQAFDDREAGFRDRDLLLLFLSGGEEGRLLQAPGAEPQPLTEAAVRRLYDHFGVPTDAFRVVLVGKDGTEKRRDAEPVSARSVFDTIDAMPMRQREMRDSSDKGM